MEPIDLILPAHNEAGSIGETLTEFYQVVTEGQHLPLRFVVCEDGSTDNTVEIVRKLSETLPILLLSEPMRKGYSRAVIDGFRASTSSLVGFIDSDGQCDPADFARLLELQRTTGCDLVIGYRNPRQDHWIRLLMSGLFAHRRRTSGVTQVYRPSKVPRIAWEHLRGLVYLKRELAQTTAAGSQATLRL